MVPQAQQLAFECVALVFQATLSSVLRLVFENPAADAFDVRVADRNVAQEVLSKRRLPAFLVGTDHGVELALLLVHSKVWVAQLFGTAFNAILALKAYAGVEAMQQFWDVR